MSTDAIIACIGAGRMGQGIAHCMAYAGHDIRLLDAKPRSEQEFEELKRTTLAEVEKTLSMIAGLGGFSPSDIPAIMTRVSVFPRAKAKTALADASVVFEGVPEVEAAKRDAFALFDAHAASEAILASTTSTMLSTSLAAFTGYKDRFLNAHWLNPAFLVPLVELSPCEETSPETISKLRALLESIGKVPVVCKATPGFIVSRIQCLAMNEAARLVEEGVASAEDIDKAVHYGFGLRFAILGLLEFIDWGGGDILYHASRELSAALKDDRFTAPEIVKKNMEQGRIGLKTRSGFLDYSNMDIEAYRLERMAAFLKSLQNTGLAKPPVL